ncbi:putative nuclease HARBI1, partial [Temnothorax longispinosus]|uniref:putative nuclease HARBI1 n=1 Tax=Temnothorax longispinosus TaxID=300112 RepID=UPI003A9A38D0
RNYKFPGVYGCIDCTHVAIFPPKINDEVYPEHAYVNRKRYHSINVQLICDFRLRIINVNARFPGSSHDVYIWNNSNARQLAEQIYARYGRNTFCLLGDSGYPLRPWLLTPIANAQPMTPEGRYNERQMSCRSLIKRCNGLLKMRFRCCLKHRVLHYSPVIASKIINTCVVLHNMCIAHNVPDPLPEEGDDLLDFGMYVDDCDIIPEIRNARRVNPDLAAGRLVQNQIVRNYFT